MPHDPGRGGHFPPKMKRLDFFALTLLALAAASIWMREADRWTFGLELVPLGAALPLFVWLRRPWQLCQRPDFQRGWALLGIGLWTAALLVDSGFLFAAAWTAWLASWVDSRFMSAPDRSLAPLLVMPLCAFPWVLTELTTITDAVVASLAAVATPLIPAADRAFASLGLITATCTVIGGACAAVHLRASSFLVSLPLLIGAAGVAALLQIGIVALAWSLEAGPIVFGLTRAAAAGFSLVVVLVLCYGVFAAQAEWLARLRPTFPLFSTWLPGVQAALLLVGAWMAIDLFAAWQTAPFANAGGLALGVWLLPIIWPVRRGPARVLPAWTRRALLAGASACYLLGTAAEIPVWQHAGLALVLIGFARRPGVGFWALGALAWLPAAGVVAERLALDPNLFAVCRILVASLAAAWGLGVLRHEWAARRPLQPSQPV